MIEEIRARLQKESEELEYELNILLPREIQKAREYGDLRENAEYKAALERQSVCKAQIRSLRQRLSEIQSIDVTKIPHDRVAYGSKVVLYDMDKDENVTYKLVTTEETDVENGIISTVSPIGQGLMGKEEGDEVKIKMPNGWRNFEIKRLYTLHDEQ